MGKPNWIRPWAGGRVRLVDGREVFVIERKFGGRDGMRRTVTLTADTEKKAEIELARFEDDPLGYQTKKQQVAAAAATVGAEARLDAPTLGEFQKDLNKLVEKGQLTELYVKQSLAPYLAQWAERLKSPDLRKITLLQLKTALRGWDTAEHKRIVALKAFTAWLRQEGRLTRRDDPTLDLMTPPIVPAKSAKAKGYPIKLIEKLYADLPSQAARDMVILRAKTGMHDTEIARLASGAGVLRRVSDPSGIEGVAVFAHLKAGKIHAVSMDAQTFAAAERLQARGSAVSRNAMKVMADRVAVRWHGCGGETKGRVNRKGEKVWETRPCKKCNPVHLGELRHSFATWSTTIGEEIKPVNQKGIDLAKVAEMMGHLSKRTTAVFYVGDRVPNMSRLPIKLEHPNDPIPMVRASATAHTG